MSSEHSQTPLGPLCGSLCQLLLIWQCGEQSQEAWLDYLLIAHIEKRGHQAYASPPPRASYGGSLSENLASNMVPMGSWAVAKTQPEDHPEGLLEPNPILLKPSLGSAFL